MSILLSPTLELTPIIFPVSELMLIKICLQPQSGECPVLPQSQYLGQNVSIPSSQCCSCFCPQPQSWRPTIYLPVSLLSSPVRSFAIPNPRIFLASHFIIPKKNNHHISPNGKFFLGAFKKLVSRDKMKKIINHFALAYCIHHAYLTSHYPFTK